MIKVGLLCFSLGLLLGLLVPYFVKYFLRKDKKQPKIKVTQPIGEVANENICSGIDDIAWESVYDNKPDSGGENIH